MITTDKCEAKNSQSLHVKIPYQTTTEKNFESGIT